MAIAFQGLDEFRFKLNDIQQVLHIAANLSAASIIAEADAKLGLPGRHQLLEVCVWRMHVIDRRVIDRRLLHLFMFTALRWQ